MDFGEFFRAVNSYAGSNGFGAAFPDFHQLDPGDGIGVRYGVVCIKPEFVEVRSVLASELGDSRGEGERFRAVSSYAGSNGFGAAFPDFHQLDPGDGLGVRYGVVCIKPEFVEVKSVLASELGDPRGEGERFRAVSSYAGSNGFGAAFPDFHQLDPGDGLGVRYGVVCIKQEAVEVRSVPALKIDYTELPMSIPNIGETTQVCLQTWMGTYVSAMGGGGDLVLVNSPAATVWEIFELHRLDENHITLKTQNGQYLCTEKNRNFVTAHLREATDCAKFGLYIDINGLVALSANNGHFLCADSSGVLLANSRQGKESEAFRIVNQINAKEELTRIEVNVYKIGTAPLWHTGTVIDGKEYYFQLNNRVETTTPKGMDLEHHRTMVRIVPGNLNRVLSILEHVRSQWNGTRYDLGGHNCNFFTDALIKSLGAPGLDQEYLNASGLAKGLRQLPGGSLVQELVVKWPINDKRLDEAFMEDLSKLVRLPEDIKREIEQFFKEIDISIPLPLPIPLPIKWPW